MTPNQQPICDLCIEAIEQGIGETPCPATEQRVLDGATYDLCPQCTDLVEENQALLQTPLSHTSKLSNPS